MSISDTVKKFQFLAAKSTLTKSEHEEAQHLMQQLKEAGMSNELIAKLSDGKWSPSTIKGYTPGIKAPNPSTWDTAIDVLESAISAGITLDDIETTVAVVGHLHDHGVNLEQVSNLLLAAKSASVNLSVVVEFQEDLKQCDLTIKDVENVLALMKQLEEQGLTLSALQPMAELLKKHGDPQDVLEAVAAFTSLAEIKSETKVATEKLENLHDQVSDVGQTLAETETKVKDLQESLDAYHGVTELGFGHPELQKLATLVGKHGGVTEVFQAVSAFTDLSDILGRTEKAEKALANAEAKTQQVQIKHGHLQTAVSMCQTMIEQHQFGLDAISTVFSIAQKFGEPLPVLKGVETYGNLKELGEELTQVQGKVAESKELLSQINSKYQQGLDHFESLHATALGVGAEVTKLEERLANSQQLAKYIYLMDDPAAADYGAYGKIVLVIAHSVLLWVEAHQQKFASSDSITAGLWDLVKTLGGK